MKIYHLLFLLFIFNSASANTTTSPTSALPAKQQKWEFDGIFGRFDRASAQRGYQV